MTRMTAKDFDQELLDLYDYYAHGKITKREFLDRAGKFAVGSVTAIALLDMLSPDYALAEQVSFTDPDIRPEYITYSSPNGHGEVRGYLVRPAGAEGILLFPPDGSRKYLLGHAPAARERAEHQQGSRKHAEDGEAA